MAVSKMSVQELEKFLHDEFPQAFGIGGEIAIESADGQTCLLRQRSVRSGLPSPPISTSTSCARMGRRRTCWRRQAVETR
jgi:hypothetical protein